MTWQLRRASVDDLDAIMAIERAVFGSDAWSADTMRGELANRHSYYLVASPVGGEDIEAYAGLRSPRRQAQSDIQTIAVTEGARRRGLGRVLMLSLIAEARDRGATEVFLEVRADNPPAQQLYERLGFERIAVRAAYYQPEGVDAVIMRLSIPAPQTGPA